MAKRLVQGPAEPVWLVGADGESIDAAHPLDVNVAGAGGGTVTADQGTAGADAWPIKDTWLVTNVSSLTVDSSNKVMLTVPAGQEYQILAIRVNFTTTATAGDRRLAVRVEHPAATITATWARAGVTQAASLTYEYLFAPGVADLTAVRVTGAASPYVSTPIPVTSILYAGDVLRVLDNQAVAAAADDMLVYVQYAYHTV